MSTTTLAPEAVAPHVIGQDPDQPLIDALYLVEGKAEIIYGRIVPLPTTGLSPYQAAQEITMSLHGYARRTRRGIATGDGLGFIVDVPNRRSFAPDAGYYTGPHTGMKFAGGAPVFAVEVRSENDYGRTAEHDMTAKREDYFAAGTLVVWDVDLQSPDAVRVYRNGNAEILAAVFRRGEVADAEPAVPGWTMPVDDLFPPAAG